MRSEETFLRGAGPDESSIDRRIKRIVTDFKDLALTMAVLLTDPQIQALLFGETKWTGSHSPKDGNLISGFVHGAIPIESFGDGQSGTAFRNSKGSHQLRRGTRAEPRIAWSLR